MKTRRSARRAITAWGDNSPRSSKWRGDRSASAALALVVLSLTCFSLWVAAATHQAATSVKRFSALSDDYARARDAVGAEESLERKYRLAPRRRCGRGMLPRQTTCSWL